MLVSAPYHMPSAPRNTVYITSYSILELEDDPVAQAHFRTLLPPIPALLTLHCLHWRTPLAEVCERYTGVSEPVQRVICGSRTAMAEMYVLSSGPFPKPLSPLDSR